MLTSRRNTPDSASPGLVAIWAGGRAFELVCVAFALLMLPVVDVRRSYSGSSGSIASKSGVDELIVVELGNVRESDCVSHVADAHRHPRGGQIGIVVTARVRLDCLDS